MDKKGLQQINRLGNAFPARDDYEWDWSPDLPEKDCKNYTTWKYRECKERGVSHKHLAIATVCTDRSGIENHAMLLVYSEEDECVYGLDNMWRSVEKVGFFRRWGYDFVRIPVYMQELMAKEG